jgi:hypothetical protein
MSDSQLAFKNRLRDIADTAEVNNFGLRPYPTRGDSSCDQGVQSIQARIGRVPNRRWKNDHVCRSC